MNKLTGDIEGPEVNGVQGRFPVINASAIGISVCCGHMVYMYTKLTW